MTLTSWNIEHGLRVLPVLKDLGDELGRPDVLCLQELRIRALDNDAINALEIALPGYRCHYSLPRDARNVTFRGGRMYGVATFVRGRWRSHTPSWDREGRVVVVQRRGLAVVNVYAVNGTSKPYYDESGRVSGDRHAWKRRFQSLVIDLGCDLRRSGEVIMAGDWNVSRSAEDTYPRLRTEEPHGKAREAFNARLREAGFIDVWRAHHPQERAYTWFNRRARGLDAARVDYVLVSQELAPRVTTDILPLLPFSDHAPVRLTMND